MVRRFAPAPLVRVARRMVDTFRRKPPAYVRVLRPSRLPSFVPFEEAYGAVAEKRWAAERQACVREVATPEVRAMTIKSDAAHLLGETYRVPEDYLAIVSGVLYSGTNDVILSPGRNVVRESCNAGKLEYLFKREFFDRRPAFVPGTSALLRSRFHNYYHLLIESLPRLLTLEEADWSAPIEVLCPGGASPVERFFVDKLGLSNVRLRPVEKRLYRLERLAFSPLKSVLQCGYVPEPYVDELRRRLHPARPSRRDRLILISRQQAGRRRVANWHALEHALGALGFVSYVLEDLAPQEQIDLFYDAEVIVGTHGAGLSNMLFAPARTPVVEIFPTTYVIPHYYMLSKSLGHPYAYCRGQGAHMNPAAYHVDVERVVDRVSEHAACL